MTRWVVVGLVVISAGMMAAADEAADRVKAAVEALAGKNNRLSTDENSAAGRFSFTFTATFPARLAPRDMSVRVARDGQRVAALVRANGVAYAYISNDLFVAMDNTAPGTLLVCEKGQPGFIFAGDGDEKNPGMRFDLTFREAPAEVRLDVGELLRNSVLKLKQGQIDESAHTITFFTERAKLTAVQGTGDGALGVVSLEIMGPGATLSVGDIASGDRANLGLLGVNLDAVKKLGMPIRMLGPEAAASVSLVPPRDYGMKPEERQAGEKLATLFAAATATRPAR